MALVIQLVWYIQKQLFTSVSVNSGGYLPCRFADRQISTTIHLHLSELLINICRSAGMAVRYGTKLTKLSTANVSVRVIGQTFYFSNLPSSFFTHRLNYILSIY